ncbi:unnamed protein product [Paramecium octaurelia]|uniref:Uncharacterized protein n=1 Tax=Paramecium octaurelia TaxID=43137 RepID=A0A8S1UW15_PAROT|nr:unnamed protein product [Paramecium octaurelia]
MMLPKIKIQANLFQEEQTKEIECAFWNQKYRGFLKTNFLITFTKQFQFIYKKMNGQLIGIDQNSDAQQNLEVKINYKKTKHLRWFGKQGSNGQKFGKWQAKWKDEILENVGGEYSKLGQKQGLWKDIIEDYWTHAQVYEVGEYLKDQKIGLWKIIYDKEEIGGGQFNNESCKSGNWIELCDNFWDLKQVTYCGEYINGNKIGGWDIQFKNKVQNQNIEKIGGGSYDVKGSNLKIGKWIELSDEFYEDNQVSYNGEYQKGFKFGRWNTYLKFDGNYEAIGGGLYDWEGNGKKIGIWIELSEGFNESNQFIFQGEYQNGIKVGRWNSYFKFNGKKEQIGGGQYDEEERGHKIGKWIELNDLSCRSRYVQVLYSGEYINNKKVGIWNTYFRDRILSKNFEIIGGGSYDEKTPGIKIGKWIELGQNFGDGLGQLLLFNIGEYKNGQKCGPWDVFWKDDIKRKKNEWLAGGQYDWLGRKIGNWVELCDNFHELKQVRYHGEYKDGKKIKVWSNSIRLQKADVQFQQIEGGQYDQKGEGQKIGVWTEVYKGFYQGSYKNGRKVGIWQQLLQNRNFFTGVFELQKSRFGQKLVYEQ